MSTPLQSVANDVCERYRDEAGLRHVKPYFHVFSTHVKARWRGQPVLQMFLSNFDSRTEEYWRRALAAGAITVNGRRVGPEYQLKDGEVICHRIHRHELPVPAQPLTVLYQDDDVLAVHKPGGIPVHPAGPHHYNSLLHLLHAEASYPLQALLPLHRLDRVTSGIVVIGRHKAAASTFGAAMRDLRVHKRYIARVMGRFPVAPGHSTAQLQREDASSDAAPRLVFSSVTGPDAAERFTEFEVQAPVPHTDALMASSAGGLHAEAGAAPQLLVRLARDDTIEQAADPALTAACPWLKSFKPSPVTVHWIEDAPGNADDTGDREAGSNRSAGVKRPRSTDAPDAAATSADTTAEQDPAADVSWTTSGYLRLEAGTVDVDVKRGLRTVQSKAGGAGTAASSAAAPQVGAAAAISAQSPRIKDCVTLFRCIAHAEVAPGRWESLIECLPLSGRTHQLRLHAAWLGHPIIDDPAYCAEAAEALLRKAAGIASDDSADAGAGAGGAGAAVRWAGRVAEAKRRKVAPGDSDTAAASSAASSTSTPASVPPAVVSAKTTGPADDAAVAALCAYCAGGPAAEYSPLQLHVQGICLHSCEYRHEHLQVQGGKEAASSYAWHFKAPWPAWAGELLLDAAGRPEAAAAPMHTSQLEA